MPWAIRTRASGRRLMPKAGAGQASVWQRYLLGSPHTPEGACSARNAPDLEAVWGSKCRLGGQSFPLRRLQALEMLRVVEGEAHQAEFRSADGPRKIAATTLLPTC
jgi:hypothetical protein